MKRFSHRIRDLRQTAQQIRQVVEAAPVQAAQLRESVLLTAGQLQQLRGEVQASFAGVYVDSEERLTQVVQEVNQSERVFADAGYELIGVELEFSPVQRVIIRLEKVAEVSLARIRATFAEVQGRRTTQALLSSILKAEEVAGRVRFENLEYTGLVVHVGAAPSVRVCWGLVEAEEAPAAPAAVAAPTPATAASLPAFADSGFFAPRTAPAAGSAPAAPPAVAPAPTQSPTPAASPPATPAAVGEGEAWGRSALEKFKTTPGFSKYRSMLRR